jgi:ankyrin repeat protein
VNFVSEPTHLPGTRAPKLMWKVGANLLVWIVMAFLVAGLVGAMLGVFSWGLNTWERSRLGPLQRAACDGNAGECERLVKSGVPVDATDEDGDTALDWAIYYGNLDVAKKLIELRSDVNHVNKWGYTPLMYTAVALRGHHPRAPQGQRNEIARLLIKHGADVNHATRNGNMIGTGQTTLHFAVTDKNPDLVRILVAAGANRNAKSDQGYTPLDIAKFPDYAPNQEVIAALQEP